MGSKCRLLRVGCEGFATATKPLADMELKSWFIGMLSNGYILNPPYKWVVCHPWNIPLTIKRVHFYIYIYIQLGSDILSPNKMQQQNTETAFGAAKITGCFEVNSTLV